MVNESLELLGFSRSLGLSPFPSNNASPVDNRETATLSFVNRRKFKGGYRPRLIYIAAGVRREVRRGNAFSAFLVRDFLLTGRRLN